MQPHPGQQPPFGRAQPRAGLGHQLRRLLGHDRLVSPRSLRMVCGLRRYVSKRRPADLDHAGIAGPRPRFLAAAAVTTHACQPGGCRASAGSPHATGQAHSVSDPPDHRAGPGAVRTELS